jgi:prepilin-type N-terminal cleavage/methylation domain-containing protein
MRRRQHGFTIVELIVAIAVTLIMMTAALMIYDRSVQVSRTVSTRSEMQAELRAAIDQISLDLNQAGYGLPIGAIPLPSAASGGINPRVGCDFTPTCYLNPVPALTSGVVYKVTPLYQAGPTITEPTDAIVITYQEPLSTNPNDPNASGTAPNWIIPVQPASAISADGTLLTMPNTLNPQINDPAVGLVIGDMLLLQNSIGTALGVVTNFSATNNTINFDALNDPLQINQPSAPVGNVAAIAASGSPPNTSVSRIMMVTYFLKQVPGQNDYQLMRQVDARTPTPVAEHIEDLKFTYDVYDSTSNTINAGSPTASIGSPPVPHPAQIRKVNITITARSSRVNMQGTFDRLTITTSISPRNLSFVEKYD